MPHATLAASLSSLFLESERMFGSRDCCFLAMDSLKLAIDCFKGTKNDLHNEIRLVTKTVTHMSPRIALLIMMSFAILEQYEEKRSDENTLEEEKLLLLEIITSVQVKRKKSVEKLLDHSDDVIQTGDIVLLHDVSHTVFDIVERAQKQKKDFSILIAEQEERQTKSIVEFLQKKGIPFTVVPEFLLTHTMESITKVLLGAVTINSLHQVIADAGSEAIVSQMGFYNIPVFVPITTDKFSLWNAEEKHHALKKVQYKSTEGVEYNKLTFSHDRYPITQVTTFITNKGCLSAVQLGELYDSYYQKNERWRTATGMC